ncbi:hypothetical protein [Treponema pectinovorum]|uniref:hypothetical protein n=1 Tax=Treponema pectinovorum TaxID=164 RepID=UPI0011CBB0B2|nr:hypothetical protein [Treponema pectinovorum]
MKQVELATLQKGVVIDMFNEEFNKVLQNIADDNVKPDAVREICIKIQIKPDKTRQTAATKVDVTSKLAPVKSSDGMMFINISAEETCAYEDNYEQAELKDEDTGDSIFNMPRQAIGGK